jgi:sterol desaturase/sphingolipid hydroxylase (fatty acid hydroxylase superfamily)
MEPSLAVLRLGIVLGLLLLLALAEARWPRRRDDFARRWRWPANLGLGVLGSLLLRLLPLAPIGAAFWAQRAGIGLSFWLQLPGWAAWTLALLGLDLALYVQHRALHELRWLWPLHRVHHADIVLDVSSGLRFHPLELLGSQLWKCAVVVALGAPPLAVLVYEVLLGASALWMHANLDLPTRLDALLRRLIVTPDVHRVHHSVHRDEHDRNYGSVLLLWDRLFASYCPHPRDGQQRMRIGLDRYRDAADQRLTALLRHPWSRR